MTSLFLLFSCTPHLYSVVDTAAYVWVAPDNSWSVGAVPEELQPTGTSVGEVPDDFLFMDQNGDLVSLWQFYGQVVVVDISTMWCAPCQDLAATVEETWETYKDDGFMYVTLLPENTATEVPSVDDLAYWADYFEITAPVLAGDTNWHRDFITDESYPRIVVIDREMKVSDPNLTPINDATILSAVETLL